MKAFQALLSFAILLLTTCQDWNYERVSFLEVSTGGANNVTANTAVLEGTISGLIDGETVSQHGHVWSTATDSPTLEDNESSSALGREGNQAFTSNASRLRANTQYYYRSYAVLREEVIYGEVNSFTTENFSLAIEKENGIIVDGNCAAINWSVISFLGDPEQLGVVWSATNENPTIDDSASWRTEQSSPFLNCSTPCPIMDELCDLESNTNFYARAYLVPGEGQPPVYSEVMHFHTFPKPVGWQQRATFPGEDRIGPFGFVIGDNIYVGGGGDINDFNTKLYKDIWSYNPAVDQWQKLITSIPEEIPSITSRDLDMSVRNKAYIATAETSDHYWTFSPESGSKWTKFPADKVQFLPFISQHFSTADKGYMTTEKLVFQFNPDEEEQGQWMILDTLPDGLLFSSANALNRISIQGKGYLTVGPAQEFWEFDPQAAPGQRFRKIDDYPNVGQPAFGFELNGKGYFGLGIDSPDFSRKIYELNPAAPPGQQWRRMPDFPGIPGDESHGAAVNGKGYVLFSIAASIFKNKDVWQFTPPE